MQTFVWHTQPETEAGAGWTRAWHQKDSYMVGGEVTYLLSATLALGDLSRQHGFMCILWDWALVCQALDGGHKMPSGIPRMCGGMSSLFPASTSARGQEEEKEDMKADILFSWGVSDSVSSARL